MNKKLRNILLLVLTLVVAAGCHRRILVEASNLIQIRIRVNVNTVTNVNANIRNTVHIYNSSATLWEPKLAQLDPSTMRVLVYDPQTDRLLSQSFISNTSYDDEGNKMFTGTLGISHGDYNFLVYNFDTPTTKVEQENNEGTILAFTDEIPSQLKSTWFGTKAESDFMNLSIRYEPEHLLVANEPDVRISPHDTLVVIETTASTVVDTYYLQIRVEGIQYASSATAVISGLSPSNKIGLNERTEQPSSAVVFDLCKGWDDALSGENKDVLCAVFNTFGKIPEITSDLRVTFNVIDTAGNLVQYEANLDDTFKTEEAILYHWLLIDETFVIPNPQPNPNPGSGGFQPQVDDWEQEEGTMVL